MVMGDTMVPVSSTVSVFLQTQQEAHIKAACFQCLYKSYYNVPLDLNYQQRGQEKNEHN